MNQKSRDMKVIFENFEIKKTPTILVFTTEMEDSDDLISQTMTTETKEVGRLEGKQGFKKIVGVEG